MLCNEAGNETLLRFVQSANALCPILVTPDGNDTEVIPVLPSNAPIPIAVMFSEPILDGTATFPPLPVYSLRTPFETE